MTEHLYDPVLVARWQTFGGESAMPIEVFAEIVRKKDPKQRIRKEATVRVVDARKRYVRYAYRVNPDDPHWRERLARRLAQRHNKCGDAIGVSLRIKNRELRTKDIDTLIANQRMCIVSEPATSALGHGLIGAQQQQQLPNEPTYGLCLPNFVSAQKKQTIGAAAAVSPSTASGYDQYRTHVLRTISETLADMPKIKQGYALSHEVRTEVHDKILRSLASDRQIGAMYKQARFVDSQASIATQIAPDLANAVTSLDIPRMVQQKCNIATAFRSAMIGSNVWGVVKRWFNKDESAVSSAIGCCVACSHSDYSSCDEQNARHYRCRSSSDDDDERHLAAFKPTSGVVVNVIVPPVAASVVEQPKAVAVHEHVTTTTVSGSGRLSGFKLRPLQLADYKVEMVDSELDVQKTVTLRPIASAVGNDNPSTVKLYPIQSSLNNAAVQNKDIGTDYKVEMVDSELDVQKTVTLRPIASAVGNDNPSTTTVKLYPIQSSLNNAAVQNKDIGAVITLYPIGEEAVAAPMQQEAVKLRPIDRSSTAKASPSPAAAVASPVGAALSNDKKTSMTCVRFINLSPSTPQATFSIGDSYAATVGYGRLSKYISAPVDGQLKVNNNTETANLQANKRYTVALLSDGKTAVVDDTASTTPPLGRVQTRVVHFASANNQSPVGVSLVNKFNQKNDIGASKHARGLVSQYYQHSPGLQTVNIAGSRGTIRVPDKAFHSGNSYSLYLFDAPENQVGVVMALDDDHADQKHAICSTSYNALVKQQPVMTGSTRVDGILVLPTNDHANGVRAQDFDDYWCPGQNIASEMMTTGKEMQLVSKSGRVYDVNEDRIGVFDKDQRLVGAKAIWRCAEQPSVALVAIDANAKSFPSND